MATKVSYKQGSKATYLKLTTRSPAALYFCTDTRELFKGDDLYSDGLRLVSSFSALPAFSVAADGILYFCEDNGCGYVLNTARTAWIPVVYGVDHETLTINELGLMRVQAVPVGCVSGLDDHVDELIKQTVANMELQVGLATVDKAGIMKPGAEFTVNDDGTLMLEAVDIAKVTGLEERLSNIEAALSPVTIAALDADQFELDEESVLHLIGVDTGIVTHRGDNLRDVLDALLKAAVWEDMGTAVDLAADDAATLVSNVIDDAILDFSDGTVAVPLTVSNSATLRGEAAGVHQNFAQEV